MSKLAETAVRSIARSTPTTLTILPLNDGPRLPAPGKEALMAANEPRRPLNSEMDLRCPLAALLRPTALKYLSVTLKGLGLQSAKKDEMTDNSTCKSALECGPPFFLNIGNKPALTVELISAASTSFVVALLSTQF